jgi:hypothetical protein
MKKLAIVKEESKDEEKSDQWISFDNEDEEHFKGRMQRSGSDPKNFNFEEVE